MPEFRAARRSRTMPLLLAAIGLLVALPNCQGASSIPRLLLVAPDGDDAAEGTERAPLQTIAAAAERARAGDTVRIRPGTYVEAVLVAGEGSRERPIVFEAEVAGSVIITGQDSGFAPLHWAGDDDVLVQSANHWVTLRGLTFRDIGDRPAVRASTGWRIEDCLFEQLSIGVNVRGHDATLTGSVFQDIDSPRAHAIVAFGGRNLRLTDLAIRRVNKARLIEDIAYSAVVKILAVDGLLIERVVSDNNVGPGLWLDSGNTNFVIRRNYISGNRGDRYEWEGPGLWIENNPSADGQIYENVITDNSGAGIEIMESSGITVRGNTLLGNAACIGLRNLDRGGENDGLRDIRIQRNLCGDWKYVGIATGIGEWAGWHAASENVSIDDGLYLPPQGAPIFAWLGSEVTTLGEAAAKFGFEANGIAF